MTHRDHPATRRPRSSWAARLPIRGLVAAAVLAAVPAVAQPTGSARARFERAVAQAMQRRPNMSDWSSIRRVAYQKSLHQRLDRPIAVLEVPRFGIDVPVLPKDDDVSLDRAVSYVSGTARPGQHGNVGIAGHRDSYFRRLERARKGDVVRLVWPDGVRTYRIAETLVLDPSDVKVLAPTGRDALTLVTCYPFHYVGHAPKRFVVRAYAEQGGGTPSAALRRVPARGRR